MATNTEISILVTLQDQASQAMQKMGANLKNMESSFKTLAVVGGAAFGTIAAIGTKAVKDYADAEKSASMLRHAVLNVTHATEDQLKATEALADALERKGVLDGDNIKMGLAQLSTFGLSNKAVQALGGSLADLAVNQFGVSASGEQLSDTANTIAKALNGQFGVLEKSGIRFTETQKKMIEFGSEMEKVKAINEGLAQNLKFTNEVALGTMEGQMAKAAVAAGNLSEAIGQSLKPIFDDLNKAVAPYILKITEWIQQNPELVKNITIFAGVLSGLLLIVGTLGLVLPAIIGGFVALATPVGLVAIAIGVLIGLFVGFQEEVKKIFSTLEEKTGIITFLKDAWQSVSDTFNNFLLPALSDLWKSLQPFKPFLEALGKVFGTILVVAIAGFVMALQGLIQLATIIISVFAKVGAAINEFLLKAFSMAQKAIDGVYNAVMRLIEAFNRLNVVQGAKSFIGNTISGAKNMLGLADGGIVTKPTVAMIGEGGEPEAVIPLSRLGAYGGGGGMVVNINGGTYLSESAAGEIGDMIIDRLKLNMKL